MPLFALGLNHHTAPLAIRERVSFQPERLLGALKDLTSVQVQEAAILSTCNRTELYFSTDTPEFAADWLARYHDLPLADMAPYLKPPRTSSTGSGQSNGEMNVAPRGCSGKHLFDHSRPVTLRRGAGAPHLRAIRSWWTAREGAID